mgnify:FL=1
MGESARISGHTHLITLIGNPTTHSLSPATHNLSFEHEGIDTVYLCFDVKDNAQLPKVIEAMKVMEGWDGSNVTMPCKQAVIPLLDELDDAAALMGAVNVIRYRDGKTKGFNTDGVGFWDNVRKHGVDIKGEKLTLIGCGGAGSAVLVQAALDGMTEIDVFEMAEGNGMKNAKELAPKLLEKTGCKVNLFVTGDMEALAASIQSSDVLVNSSPVGMGEGCTDTPVPAELIKPGSVVADTVYFPRETQLINDARAKGCTVVGGLGMMIEQAAVGEEIWYGIKMDTDMIERELYS